MSGTETPGAAWTQPAWDVAWSSETFSIRDLVEKAGIAEATAANYVSDWERKGVVDQCGKDGSKYLYRVIRSDEKSDDRTTLKTATGEITLGTAKENMWRTMRMLRSFTKTELRTHSDVPDVPVAVADANSFCNMLLRGGYLRIERKATPGKREARYRLIKDTGPRPPKEKRVRAVWDENTKEFVHVAGVSE